MGMVCASGGGGADEASELARLEAEWEALMAETAAPAEPLVDPGALHHDGTDALRAAERAVRAHERRAEVLQDRIAALAAGRPDEPVILARMLQRIGERRDWALEDLPPALVRRLIGIVAAGDRPGG